MEVRGSSKIIEQRTKIVESVAKGRKTIENHENVPTIAPLSPRTTSSSVIAGLFPRLKQILIDN
jgi:hypothetical protein